MSHRLLKGIDYGEFFPEAVEIVKTRFPEISEIKNWMRNSGFARVSSETVYDQPITIGELYILAKNKVLSTLGMLSPEAFEKGMGKLRIYMKVNREKKFERPMTLVYGEK